MNYHDKRNKKRSKLGIKSDWSVDKPGLKVTGRPISYGRLPGNEQDRFYSQSELYLVEPCFCERCTKFLKENYGIKAEWTNEPISILVELESDEKFLEYEFEPRGSHKWNSRKGIVKLLRMLQADVKGPWTTKPFMFLGRLVRPGHWQIERFDRLTRKEQQQAKPINARTLQKEKSGFDDKLGFEDKAQMNREFEKRFAS